MSEHLLYFSPATRSGLADYAREQADAICGEGVEVKMLTSQEFKRRSQDHYELLPMLRTRGAFPQGASRIGNRLTTIRQILSDFRALSNCIVSAGYRRVLFGSYIEYLSPLWAWRLRRLARKGVVFGAVVHDPVRDFVVGPVWWHRKSIQSAYSFLHEAFVHEPVVLDTIRPMPQLRTTVIPHGPYQFPPSTNTREIMRKRLGLPGDSSVLLAFGGIRDGKNLDLVLKAMRQFPRAFLVVAGREQSQGQKPAAFYQELAEQLGVADRCRWNIRFIPEEEIGDFFAVADVVLLTYSAKFRSASGVLGAAIHFRKRCLASSGQGNLSAVFRRFELGEWVEPDSEETLARGLRRLLDNPATADWEEYERENSWSRNAQLVVERLFGPKAVEESRLEPVV